MDSGATREKNTTKQQDMNSISKSGKNTKDEIYGIDSIEQIHSCLNCKKAECDNCIGVRTAVNANRRYNKRKKEAEKDGELIIRKKTGKMLENARKNAGMTRTQFAKAMKLSTHTIKGYENGSTRHNTYTLCKMCDVLGTTINKIMGGD